MGEYLREIPHKILPRPNYIILLDCTIETDLPVMNFDTNKSLSELRKISRIPSLYVIISTSGVKELEIVLKKIQVYPGFLEIANIVITLPHTPGEDLSKLLMDNMIFKVIFISSTTGKMLDLSRNRIANITESFNPNLIPRTLRICYFESMPYTILGTHQKGLEIIILDLAARSANINITFFNSKLGSCSSGESLGNYQYLLNRTCDGSLGATPCLMNTTDFDLSTTYMDDGIALVAPRLKCPRNIASILLSKWLMSFLVLCSSLVWLVELVHIVLRSRESIVSRTKAVLFLVVMPLNLGMIVVLGYWQGQLYNNLVRVGHSCSVNNINDIREKGLPIGIEPDIFNIILTTIFQDMNEASIRKYISVDSDIMRLDPKKCHILKIGLFRYLMPKIYMKRGQMPVFRLVEVFKRVMFGTYLRKGYPLLRELNKGLGRLQRSGLVYYIRDRIFRNVDLKDIMSQSKFSMQFLPVTFAEIYWVLMWLAALWMASILVFTWEVLTSAKRK
ncbi:uncharacterized protein [Euwallacea fornicatus]|uniref:uncharacterized protein n=1 Tax=Euwallacea fornicatus TaxID=995702 RepID=UPI00338DB050